MPIGTTNIGMTAVAAELRDPVSLGSPIRLKDDLFVTCQADGYIRVFAGNFHNTAMGPATNNTFKEAIGDPYNANANMALRNWASYDHVTGFNWLIRIYAGLLDVGTEFSVDINLLSESTETETLVSEPSLFGGTTYTYSGTTTIEAFDTVGSNGFWGYTMEVTIQRIQGQSIYVWSQNNGGTYTAAEDSDGSGFINWRRKLDPNAGFLDIDVDNVSWPQVLVEGDDGFANIAGNKRTSITLELNFI